ncbi:MAG: heparinase [Armatimonadetes bacterium CG_4_10_14_3_um_filter_66_18]|nr:heparinase [Armatimonadota bacterium]OIO95393.1 MAG: hypothetical protein AUJ96_26830 [Armatimonadetes bacterium CG2_30_66_41]PIU91853.1 MAG: heparinase [Armatimonadetes bacterium CG06_land_8_20_14_3_00_66_21]PIW13433.1 MAG: heparinase [Armatimonadetes bacterium CG17_big_fil_post_rev_8_21_14_2_50_66_6]PIX46777.1 MAG: heparinase [Armatimonadetes bacterium CG_4_8_14_3_um_filter_66_20]PIY37581.1 MAG: heparinase [Armatimonadetes bacterium CG_4_10_14_3_um_filter_66_18]PIZ47761.1 MAG: heparinase
MNASLPFVSAAATLLIAGCMLLRPTPSVAEGAALPVGRVQEIAALLLDHPVAYGCSASDRTAWQDLAKREAFGDVVDNAEKLLSQPIPELPDDLYLDFSKTGNRTRWQRVNSQRDRFLNPLVLAECLENKGRFLPKLEELVRAFCAERTWVMPAHDSKLTNFEGEVVDIDLKSSARGWELATTLYLLGGKLSPPTQKLIRDEVTRRILDPYRDLVEGKRPRNWWMTTTNNWNAVCLAGVTGSALALLDGKEERAFFVAAAEEFSKNFLKGFPPDGYCSEGVGYWNYGFGNYLNLAEIIYQATEGKRDLMALPEVRAPATFGARIGILNGVCPAFADCSVNARPDAREMWYVSRKYRLGLRDWESQDPGSPGGALFEALRYSFPNSASKTPPADEAAAGPALRDWFEDAGLLICRPAQGSECRLGVALKGGHNAEHHNHNDVGSYVVLMGSTPILLDPGAETYSARTFSAKRYESKLLNSFGHPVPVVAGQLQRPGADAKGKVVRTDFTEAADTLVVDLRAPYAVRELEKLERTFVYSREGAGSLMVRDEVAFSSPQAFGTALLTLGQWKQAAPGSLTIYDFEEAARIEISATGAALEVSAEQIEEDAPVKPTRLGLNLTKPVTEASITVTITPLDLGGKGAGVRNGDFELGSWGWRIPNDGFSALSTEQAASGTTSLKITDADTTRGSTIDSARMPAKPGAKDELRGKYFGVSGDGVGMYVRFLDANGNALNVDERGWLQALGGIGGSEKHWKPFVFPFAPPKETVNLQIWIHSANAALVEGYLDDLEIVESK